MDLICPECYYGITANYCNPDTDLAYCRSCRTKYRLSELAETHGLDYGVLRDQHRAGHSMQQRVPPGCRRYSSDAEAGERSRTAVDWIALAMIEAPGLIFCCFALWFLANWLAFMLHTPGRLFGYFWAVPFCVAIAAMLEGALVRICTDVPSQNPRNDALIGAAVIVAILAFGSVFWRDLPSEFARSMPHFGSTQGEARDYVLCIGLATVAVRSLVRRLRRRDRRSEPGAT